MRPQTLLHGTLTLTLAAALCGCQPQQPFYFGERGDLSHYLGVATNIDYPDADERRLSEVECAIRPFSLANSDPKEIWELKLEDAIRYALQNSKVMRSLGGASLGQSSANPMPDYLMRFESSPGVVQTIYDPAIADSDPRFGVEGALSLFDAQWTTDIFWEKNNEPRDPYNSVFVQALFPQDFKQDQAQFQTEISKTDAAGGQLAVRHNVQYDKENSARKFLSDWTTNLEVEIRQPLLQGAGVQFNRIAGPRSAGSVPGFNQGVMLARIRADIALTNFEAGVRNLISDVEVAYWDLYGAYRDLDAAVKGRNSALETWRKTYALFKAGAKGGEKATEAQAREQYFIFRATVEQALKALYDSEAKLRYIMGLSATDGRLIRPADEPTTARVAFDWADAHAEALCRSVELREQKWRIKQRELELVAAKNYLLPQLDAVARYRWLGLGDDLFPTGRSVDATGPFSQFAGAYDNLLDGNYQDWHLELQLRVPIGFRREMANVRNAQLALARERAILQDQELELSHQLSFAMRDAEANLVLSQTNFNRGLAAKRQVEAIEAAYDTGTITIDVLLRAQQEMAQAESTYHRSVVNYNKAIANVHFRKGSLLEYNGVCLAEGPWPGKAYFDARRRARARDAACYLDYGFTNPPVLSRGAYDQVRGRPCLDEALQVVPGPLPKGAPDAEHIPAPTPEAGSPLNSTPSSTLKPQPDPLTGGAARQGWQTAQSPRREATVGGSIAPSGPARARDLATVDWTPLTGKPDRNAPGPRADSPAAGQQAGAWQAVRPVAHEESLAPAAQSATAETGGWRPSQR